MKTLVIEDDLKSQCLLAKVLAERGHEVTTFESAEQAILAYQKDFYPLVFVDAGLPGMDGLQFCRWIRSQPNGERVFVMVATEPNLPQDVSQVLELGANDFLSKPYELNGLRARLSIAEQQMDRFFEQQQLEQALEDETKRWTQVEADIAELREGYENQLHERDAELKSLRERIDNEMASRAAIEKQLADWRSERAREVEELEQSRTELNGRIQELESALGQVRDSERDARSLQSKFEAELAEAQAELATRGGADDEELARVREALHTQQEQSQRLAAALGEVRQEHMARIREIEGQLARSLSAAEQEHARREQAELELADVREQLAARVKAQTSELLALSEQLKTHLDDRRRLDLELNQTRDDLARRSRDQMAEVLRLSDEFRAATMERQRLEEELARARREQLLELNQRQQELDETVRRLRNEASERQQLEEALEAERRLVEAAVSERRAAESLLEESIRTGQVQRDESARVIECQRREEEERRSRLDAELEQSRRTVQEQQSEMTRLGTELALRNETVRQLEETTATHREARKRVESRWRALTRLSPELNLAETPEDVSRTIAILAQDLVGWEMFSLDAYAENGDWIHPILSLESIDGRVAETGPFHPGPQPTSLMRRVLEDGPQLLLRPAPSCSQTDLMVFGDRARRSASLLYVPVKAGHRVLGFLSVRSVTLEAYDGDDIETLMTLAALCGGALDRLEWRGRSRGAGDPGPADRGLPGSDATRIGSSMAVAAVSSVSSVE
jgi:DNA-binding response OmpR family regulator